MTINQGDSLGLLRAAGASKPAGPSAAPRPAGPSEGEFADLLRRASSGELVSGAPVSVDRGAGVELTEDQLARLSLAADKAEAEGIQNAVVMMDGAALLLDVKTRTILKQIDLSQGVLSGTADAVDGMVRRIQAEWPDATPPKVVATGGLAVVVGPLLTTIDNAYDVVVHAHRQTCQRFGNRRRANDNEPSRRHERLDVDVNCSLRGTHHRNDDMFTGRRTRLVGVRSNRHQPAGTGRQGVERLLADDFARARAADEPLHAPIRKHDCTIAEVRRHRGTTRHDRGQGKALPFTSQRRYLLEAVHGPMLVTSSSFRVTNSRTSFGFGRHQWSDSCSSIRAARVLSGSRRPANCP